MRSLPPSWQGSPAEASALFPRMRYSYDHFSDALADLLRQENGDPRARINLREFFRRVDGWEYETLRKQVAGERTLQPEAIEAMAAALHVVPEYFQEYRRYQIEKSISDHPELVDLVYDLLVTRSKSLDAAAAPLVSIALDMLAERHNLDADLASKVLDLIIEGQVGDIQTAAFLMGLRVKGESGEEISGFARSMQRSCTPVHIECDEPLMDIVSTGGDRLATFNISSTAAFVAAGAGVKMAKHGSRGQTSYAGAADLMQSLGARIDLLPEAIARCVCEVGFGFMFAPLHYTAIRRLLPVRRSLNMPTVFNMLGPILNPASVKRQLTGVSDARHVPVLAEALARLGSERAMVVHGEDGLDEISASSPTIVVEVRNGECSDPFHIYPELYGLRCWPLKYLVGGDPAKNASITRRVLAGEPGAPLDVVLINAGAAIYLADKAESIHEGIELAREAVQSGRALEILSAFVEFTQSVKKTGGARP
ncbi:MAG: anthranilate phosphoribosyltransferase [Actinobacteria bacterium]|nr:anthranilate phosphoribosyltransferase [Actinomycetota bacterium]